VPGEYENLVLRVYLRSIDKYRGTCAADHLIEQAHRWGLAGATLLRGILGLDRTGELAESNWWSIKEVVPVVGHFVDTAEAINSFMPLVQEIAQGGVRVLMPGSMLSRARARRFSHASERPVAPYAPEHPPVGIEERGELLRISMAESDLFEGQPLYRAIVLRAQELRLATAAVFRGAMGFADDHRIRTATFWRRPADLPLLVDIVDAPRNVRRLLPFLEQAAGSATITLEDVWMGTTSGR
jgi:uncharacterized protein